MARRLLVLICVTMAVLTAAITWSWQQSEEVTLSISTGEKSGVYHAIGKRLAEVLADHQGDSAPPISLEVLESSGSQENLKRLERGEVDLALVQNHSEGNLKTSSIAGLYNETLHLIAHRDSNIASISDLLGNKVSTGQSNSGTTVVANALLLFAFGDAPQAQVLNLSISEALEAFERGELDAAFAMTGFQSSLIREAINHPDLHLVPIVFDATPTDALQQSSEDFIDGFRTAFPYAQAGNIPMHTYGLTPTKPVPSVNVRAVLVCQRKLNPTYAQQITEFLFQSISEVSATIPSLQGLSEQTAQEFLRYPIHPGALSYYNRSEPGFWVKYAELMGFLLTLTVMFWSFGAAIASYASRNRKNHIDEYYLRIQKLDQKLSRMEESADTEAIINQIRSVESEAIDELMDENLRPDNSFIILQQMVLSAINKHTAKSQRNDTQEP